MGRELKTAVFFPSVCIDEEGTVSIRWDGSFDHLQAGESGDWIEDDEMAQALDNDITKIMGPWSDPGWKRLKRLANHMKKAERA